MCLGIPGQVIRWIDRDPTFGRAEIEFDGIRRVCHMACVPDSKEGDYVIVHAGIAISRIDEQEARRIFDELQELGLRDELDELASIVEPAVVEPAIVEPTIDPVAGHGRGTP